MEDTKKLLQAIINGQSAMKSELLGEVNKIRKEMNKGFEDQQRESREIEKRLTKRIDTIGLQIANLEDDTPTQDEYSNLERRVEKLEQKIVSV